MTSDELEAYKAEIINEILDLQKIRTLDSIKNIINREARKTKGNEKALIREVSQEIMRTDNPCCYTAEEVKKHIISEIGAYQQGNYITNSEITKITLRWSESAFNDLQAIQRFVRIHCEKYSINVDGAINSLLYNIKAGKKDKELSDMLGVDIRFLNLSRYCKMYYTIMPDCVYILVIQNSCTKLKLHYYYQ